MHEIFKGWRRKLGCLTLVIALPILVMWIKGSYYLDYFRVIIGQTNHHLFSCDGAVRWEPTALSPRALRRFQDLAEWTSKKRPDGLVPPDKELGVTWFWKWGGFFFGTDGDHPIRIIPYWPILTSLTLASACLILWKPRKKLAQPKSSPRISN